jgi:signal transduction histidine kinase
VAFITDIPYKSCETFVDYNRLTQVITNFVINAAKYTLEIRNDSVFSYLPYFGVAYNAPYGGGKSLNFNASITGYTTRALKKGKIQIDFKTRSDEDNYEYRLTIFPDGSTSIHVQPMNKQSISFTGEMDTEK